MAGSKPFFIVGANAKIKLNSLTVAFATDVSYRVSVDHASPRVLGKFEVEVHQPLKYDVSGTLTVIRYAKDVSKAQNAPSPSVDRQGNGVGSLGTAPDGISLDTVGLGGPDGRPNENFNPSKMFQSRTFDIEIFQKVDGDQCQIAKLRGCRFSEMSFRMSKRSSGQVSYSFVAQYLDEDSFNAGKSGVGQELS